MSGGDGGTVATIAERDLRAALALYDGWTYAPKNAKGGRDVFYPVESRVCAMYLPQVRDKQHTDCCSYAEGVVLAAARLTMPRWNRARHRRSMIADESQGAALRWLRSHPHGETHDHRTKRALLHGLPDELHAVGLAAEPVSTMDRPPAGEWWVGQLWERDWSSGHAVLVEGREGGVAIHEASKSAGRVITRAVTAWPLGSHYWQRWARLRISSTGCTSPPRS